MGERAAAAVCLSVGMGPIFCAFDDDAPHRTRGAGRGARGRGARGRPTCRPPPLSCDPRTTAGQSLQVSVGRGLGVEHSRWWRRAVGHLGQHGHVLCPLVRQLALISHHAHHRHLVLSHHRLDLRQRGRQHKVRRRSGMPEVDGREQLLWRSGVEDDGGRSD